MVGISKSAFQIASAGMLAFLCFGEGSVLREASCRGTGVQRLDVG